MSKCDSCGKSCSDNPKKNFSNQNVFPKKKAKLTGIPVVTVALTEKGERVNFTIPVTKNLDSQLSVLCLKALVFTEKKEIFNEVPEGLLDLISLGFEKEYIHMPVIPLITDN